ncbi:winged helix-turn-helix transcriptional regulator [Amycolatopsis sp. CA-126428]|uniref:winged helix-turn-helix transcriptional regulator n=1 Tax=Amycolatopsis sp. CA-126428 TaxID=2073158 RepID=UPI000CD0D7A5|nr:winged helix-turn-helix transcriptional regulator [Amycolatopsis sp. CA-126428]
MAESGLVRVICCPGAVELLDELASGARTVVALRRAVPRRVLASALRALAAEGAIRRSAVGTWDGRPGGEVLFSLTAAGYRLVGELSDLDLWVEVYERYLNG